MNLKSEVTWMASIPNFLNDQAHDLAISLIDAGEWEIAYEEMILQGSEVDAPLSPDDMRRIRSIAIEFGLDLERGGDWLAALD
ncbi:MULTISPECIES: hypothetical protein [unclassified Rathayibacter]|uniref:hypothetical protein n=1 Tax=unclassified Rathayibacter TaxID=2609250 RepID=UPI00104D481E|nr:MULTISPECIES: hypothetical protein [unclassified Rathayibacter]MCJ1704264.1 hypothetical protein [Rathayibacter sp. VKM Ac-2926]TCL83030.1 hypothetical protein EDF49_10483 [Rathayibacter sp. PhB192]TCM28528.1 hypothetical protein EDF43_10484 [Rathayibacter sp. PhB179]